MNRYYARHPRDFSNEYTVFVVEAGSENEERLKTIHDDVKRITRERAIKLGIRDVRHAKRHDAIQHYGGLEMPHDDSWLQGKPDSKILSDAKRGTARYIDQKWEAHQAEENFRAQVASA